MKKLFITGLSLLVMSGIFGIAFADNEATTPTGNPELIKGAIAKYKEKNFLGCISDLRQYVMQDPSSAVGWYYLGNAYMNIAMKQDAHYSFDKVVQLNTVPKLTSYAIQAKVCMENPARCEYQNFNANEISQLKANPQQFLESYFAAKKAASSNVEINEINRLINGSYTGRIHPSAQEVLRQEHAMMEASKINKKSYVPAFDLLRQNNQTSTLAMMLELQNNKDENKTNNYLMDNYSNMTPEMIQTMIMQNSMMQNF